MARNKQKSQTQDTQVAGRAAASDVAASMPSTDGKKLSETALTFLYKEYDHLKDLYIQAEQTAQNIFNFYLTLITTITGGIVILLQIAENNALNSVQSLVTVSGMLLFAAMIGSVYLSSITGRYAHMARYAGGMDQIRHFLIDRLDVPLPPVYRAFTLQAKNRQPPGRLKSIMRAFYWLLPTGTYMLFIAAFNSLSLAIGTGLLLYAGGELQHNFPRGALIIALIFGLCFLTYNIYSQWVRRKLYNQLNVQFDSRGELDWIAGKQ
jgi:hypothetical protein